MNDLIYSFLLHLDYPRASVVFDNDLLAPSPQVGSGMKVPTFIVVDTDTADPLAVIEVADAASTDSLKEIGTRTGAYASRLAGTYIQAFVIRVDARANAKDRKVQFYRVWPNSTLRQLSSKNFPNYAALQVNRKLACKSAARALEASLPAAGQLVTSDGRKEIHAVEEKSPGAGLYLPALVLLVLVVADAVFNNMHGKSLLTLSHSVLAIGAAVLFTLPAAIRYLRQ